MSEVSPNLPGAVWPDPTKAMLHDPLFEAVWQVIKTWDINVPAAYEGYCGATGNHVRAIIEAVPEVPCRRCKREYKGQGGAYFGPACSAGEKCCTHGARYI